MFHQLQHLLTCHNVGVESMGCFCGVLIVNVPREHYNLLLLVIRQLRERHSGFNAGFLLQVGKRSLDLQILYVSEFPIDFVPGRVVTDQGRDVLCDSIDVSRIIPW